MDSVCDDGMSICKLDFVWSWFCQIRFC